MARMRRRISATSAGENIFSITTVSSATDFVDINDLVKEQVENWQRNPKHQERLNYKLHVLGGSETELASFVLEHKDETYKSAVADVWELDVSVVNESGHLRVACAL